MSNVIIGYDTLPFFPYKSSNCDHQFDFRYVLDTQKNVSKNVSNDV